MEQSQERSMHFQQQQQQQQQKSPATSSSGQEDLVKQYLQYKIQVLLHINSLLLSKLYTQQQQQQQQDEEQDQQQQQKVSLEQRIHTDYLKRVHSNLQCISSLHQGNTSAKPLIMDPPINYTSLASAAMNGTNVAPGNTGNTNDALMQQQEEGLRRLYLLLNRMFELW